MKPLTTASLALLVAVGCAAPVEPPPLECAPAVAPEPMKAAEMSPAVSEHEALKEAALRVYLMTCALEQFDAGFQDAQDLVARAGPDIIPIFVELMADPEKPDRLARSAARVALKYPFSAHLRTAIRERRERPILASDNYWAMFELYDFFVKFGDESDLIWMEKAVERLWDQHRQYGIDKLKLFRSRMQTN